MSRIFSRGFDRRFRTVTTPSAERSVRMGVTVVFTTPQASAAALKAAGTLGASLGGRITLLVPYIVPFPLPLNNPQVRVDFLQRQYGDLAASSGVDTEVVVCLCRDEVQLLNESLAPGSLVVVGGRKRFWTSRSQRLARRLKQAGHEVIFVEVK